MDQNSYHGLALTGGQPSPRTVTVATTPINRQNVPPITPKPSRPLNRKGQTSTVCQRVNYRNGSVSGNNNPPPPPNQLPLPTGLTRRPSVDSHREGQSRLSRANHVLSPTTDPSASPTSLQKPQKPRTTHKFSDPSTNTPKSQPKRPPSRAGAPEHTGSSNPHQHNPHARGRTPGPPPVIPKSQRRRATSRSSTREQSISRQAAPRMRPHCREWLKGYCPEGSKCRFAHDAEARAAEEIRLKKVAEEQAALEAFATVDEMVLPWTKVTFGAGVTVKEVLTGQETCRVLVKNLPLTTTRADVITLFAQPGLDPAKFTVRQPRQSLHDRSHLEAVVEFYDLKEGKNAVAGLDQIEFGSEKLRLLITSKQEGMGESKGWNSYILTVTWPAPSNVWVGKGKTRNYNLDYSIASLQTLVVEAFPDNYEAVIWEPNLVADKRGLVSAKLRFPTWSRAKAVHDFLDQKPLPLCPRIKYFVSLPAPFHYTIYVPHPQYKAQQQLFQSLIPARDDRTATAHLRISANQPDRPARIELSGPDKKTIGRLKVRIEQLIAGEKLPQWDRVFYGPEGETFLKKVNDESRAYVRADKRQGTLKAYGETAPVERAKAMIQGEVNRLASLRFQVPLKRASVRFFMDGARGSTLLKEEVGEENVMLDVSSVPCKVVVRGGESARHCLDKLIRESLSHAVRSQHQLKDGETCPVCCDAIDQPYRLACNHVYCHGCLRHFLLTASDTKNFPLLCLGEEGGCGVPISLPVIQRFLLPAQFKRLLEISFLEYLGHHPNKYRYCTTPDCPEIYALESGSGDGIFRCRSCFVAVCISCREEHDGFSCEEWKAHRDPEAQERLLEGWVEGNKLVKKCPQCKILIEKNGGCNHVICRKCSAHICWTCMGVFEEKGIYHHMELVHGGIDDEGGVLFGVW